MADHDLEILPRYVHSSTAFTIFSDAMMFLKYCLNLQLLIYLVILIDMRDN